MGYAKKHNCIDRGTYAKVKTKKQVVYICKNGAMQRNRTMR